jgi:hypothetical protein|tara:strand:+ start:564 stop:941 length:378 start_codon:yes stop_codon:yes gene_type:complete
MSDLKYCQGPRCHQHQTQDRLKGPKGNKTYQTRRRSHMYYGTGNFCSMNCYNEWAEVFIDQAIDHFGRLTEPKILTEQNAWRKTYDWDNGYENRSYVYRNGITNEQRPLTEAQFDDSNYTLNTGE